VIKSYQDLIVWQKSIRLVKLVYELTGNLPKEEQFGLVSQMRRSAVAIPSNIAEGYRRQALGEYLQFLYIANASAAELETQIIICKNIFQKINCDKANDLLTEIIKMMNSLIAKLKIRRQK